MSISKNEVIDPTYKGNLARFINHSCDPNCETQKWHVLGEVCVGIFTLRDVNEGEELTFNYGFDILKTTFQKCLCKAKNCKGYLGVAQNEVSNSVQNIFCMKCGKNCRNIDPILVCEKCKKIYHKNCLKPKQMLLIEDKYFYCKSCLNKNEKKQIKDKIKQKREIYDEENVFEIKNIIQSLKEIKVENSEKPINKTELTDFKPITAVDIEIKVEESEIVKDNIPLNELNIDDIKKEKEEYVSIKSEDQQSILKASLTNLNIKIVDDIKESKIIKKFYYLQKF